jgi:Restriction endonuclease
MTRALNRRRHRRDSDLFEQRIHRIHELLDGSGADVTWNDRVPDPDNPKQQRQIDVTVRRGNHLTLIECRIRKSRQDVKWIEELIGRRASLRAHSVLAVSASGFTSGAIRKARQHLIAVRDLRTLTDADIARWGQSIDLSIIYYQYSNLSLTLWIDGDVPTDADTVKNELAVHPIWTTAFNQAATYLTDNQMITEARINTDVEFGVLGEPDGLLLLTRRVRFMAIQGRARAVLSRLSCPKVEAYGEPGLGVPDAVIQRFNLGETSIVHDGERAGVVVDISAIQLAPLCQFRFVKTAGSGGDGTIESLELIGVERLNVTPGPIKLMICRAADFSSGSWKRG